MSVLLEDLRCVSLFFYCFLLGLVLVSLGCSMSFAFLLLEIFEACFCCLVIFYVFDFSFA